MSQYRNISFRPYGMWLCALVLSLSLQFGCAGTLVKSESKSYVRVLDEKIELGNGSEILPEMTPIEIAHWSSLIDKIVQRLGGKDKGRGIDDALLIKLKKRLNHLVTDSLTTHRSFPHHLDNRLKALLADIDRAIVAKRAPRYSQIISLPSLEPDKRDEARLFQLIWPTTDYRVTSPFGYRKDPFTGKISFHDGIDLAAKRGSLIVAAESGRIIFSGWRGRAGKLVVVEHAGGYHTFYAHLSDILTVRGLTVDRGQPLGLMGNSGRSTGVHLHFKITYNGRAVDPQQYVGQIMQ